MRGLFVTGTDTGVGKTVLSAALLAAMAAAGEAVRAHKPVVTGLDAAPWTDSPESRDGGARESWPSDHVMLGRAAAMESEAVSPLRYRPAVSPHLAAELAGERIDPARVIAAARDTASGDAITVVEGVGGLLVPLTDDLTVRDLAVALGLPLLIAARPGLGTINHTLLTLRAARAAGLQVRAVVLTPWRADPSTMERSNRQTIARLGEVEVEGLARVPAPSRDMLALAGAALPWRRWLAGEDLVSSES